MRSLLSVFLFVFASTGCGLMFCAAAPADQSPVRKSHLVHDAGSIKPTRPKRTTPYIDVDQTSPKSTRFHVMNAFTSDDAVSVRLPLTTFDEMNYGDARITDIDSSLKITDSYRVSVGNESYRANVSQSITQIPHNSDIFIVTDVDVDGSLRDMFSIWDRDDRLPAGHFWLLTYNAFSHSGLDVLVFDPSKVGTNEYSLQRIGMNIDSFDAYFVELPVSNYELKVVPHDVVQDIDDFKNSPSLIPPTYISPEEGARYYGSVIGVYGKAGKYQPDYVTAPPLPAALPFHYPSTRVVVINAYCHHGNVQVEFKSEHLFRPLSYGGAVTDSFHLKKYDPYRIKSQSDDSNDDIGSSWISGHVKEIVPYMDSECLLIADMGPKEQLEKFFLCWESYDLDVASDDIFFFTYHALTNYPDPVDVVLFDRSAVADPDTRSLLSIADHMLLGHGLRARIPVPKTSYEVKVVKSGSIRNSLDFDKARSLLQPMTIKPIGGQRYYVVLSGISQNKDFPPDLIFFPSVTRGTPRMNPTLDDGRPVHASPSSRPSISHLSSPALQEDFTSSGNRARANLLFVGLLLVVLHLLLGR